MPTFLHVQGLPRTAPRGEVLGAVRVAGRAREVAAAHRADCAPHRQAGRPRK